MNRLWQTLACGVLVAALGVPLAFAQSDTQSSESQRGSDRPNVRAASARVTANAPGVRLAGLIRNDGFILRNKGIASVTMPSRGVFCIKPTAGSGINTDTAVVQVTVDWSRSEFNESLVQWASEPRYCSSSQFEIHTLWDREPNAIYTQSDRVAFSIIVP